MLRGRAPGRVQRVNINGNQQNGSKNNDQEPAQFLAFKEQPNLSHQQQEIQVEINTEQQHENAGYNFRIGRVRGKAVIQNSETARTGGAKGKRQRIKPVHTAAQQQDHQQQRHAQVDSV